MSRRRFGSVRRLPSGRWQARYRTNDGRQHTAPETFASKTAATRHLAQVETDLSRGQWSDPRLGRTTFIEWAARWEATTVNLRANTRATYRNLLRRYLLPTFGPMRLADLDAMVVRAWLARPEHARFRFLSDYAAHPDGALSWRFERARGGNGVLGDLGAHGVDLVRHLLGEIDALVADTAVFIPARPRPIGATAGHERGGGEPGPVENDDYFGSLLRMASGARVMLDCSRVAVGEQNSYGFEIHGTRGALTWDFRRMGELAITGDDGSARTVFVGPPDGDFGAFQPGAGIPMGYDDLKVIEAARFLRSIAEGVPYGATLDDAIRSAEALDAMTRAAATGGWVKL